jgi:hypothetical protein
MALPVTFATLPAGNEPLSLFDTQSAAIAALGVIPCSAAGQNTVALTPNANTPTILGYTDLAPSFSFAAAQTSNGSVTLNVAGLGARNAYKWNGQQAMGAGDSVAGSVYKATFLTALNGGSGGFVVDTVGASSSVTDLECVIDGGGVAITTGAKASFRIPFAAVIAQWSVIADQPGSIAVDILRANNAVPVTSMIGGGNKPSLVASQFNSNVAISGWTSSLLTPNDFITFSVSSVATVTRVTVDLDLFKQ